jgi:peptide/nickel transport system permease protein
MATTTSTAIATPFTEQAPAREVSQLALTWQRFRRNRSGILGLWTLAALVLAAIMIPLYSPYTMDTISIGQLNAPAWTLDTVTGQLHIMGTDYTGRDNFTRLFYGGRTSLLVTLIGVVAVAILGSIIGAVAGLSGGWVDSLLMRFTDFMLSLPLIPLYIFTIKILRPSPVDYIGTVGIVAFLFIMFNWMTICRLVRGSILSLRNQSFVEASRALGANKAQLIFRHLLPNSFAPVLVAATFIAGDFILWEATLAYFGQGITEPPAVSWGNMLAGSQDYVWYFSNMNPFQEMRGYLLLAPIFMIMLTVLSINYIGDALRDALDPHRTR